MLMYCMILRYIPIHTYIRMHAVVRRLEMTSFSPSFSQAISIDPESRCWNRRTEFILDGIKQKKIYEWGA